MAGHQYIYQLQGLTKIWPGGRKIFENIHLSFLADAKIGIVGVNGSGKSTLLRIMAGLESDFSGEALAATNIKIGYLPQEPHLDHDKNVWDNVIAHCPEKAVFDAFTAAAEKLAEDYSDAAMEDMNALQEQVEARNAWDIDSRISMAMSALRCPAPSSDTAHLSGGEKRRIALCRLLLSGPDMLLLDEPTNHLDAETTAWLQAYLTDFPGCVVLITHDRYFLDQVTGWILELDRGRGLPHKGNYSSWLEKKMQQQTIESRETDRRSKKIKRELEWIHASPKARQAKSKARINAYQEMAARAETEKVTSAHITIPPGPRLGDLVVEADNLGYALDDGRILIQKLCFRLPPGAILGVIGPNGAGKSTLLHLISGQQKPTSGHIRLGSSVRIGHVDQSRDMLDQTKTVWEEISGGAEFLDIGERQINARAYAGQFNFKGGDQQKKLADLSGGERGRIHLGKTLLLNANLLLLDEPTNDLDVETLQSLEAGLEDFPGCAVIVSHDRWFLDRLATHVLAFAGDGKIDWMEGNVSAWLEKNSSENGPGNGRVKSAPRKFSRK